MDSIIRARDLSFAYTDELVLQNITLEVLPGEFLSVIGPNGSGKTTLLKLLYGYLSPSKGNVSLGDTPIKKITRRDLARRIAVVSQMPRFHFELTAFEFVLMGRSPHMGLLAFEGKEDFEAASEAMTLTDVADFKERNIFSLSGGELQRVLIARALAQAPQVMLLDEPTSYLDIKHQVNICQLLKKMNKDKAITIVSVFHDINLASYFSDRVMVMKEGRIHGVGPPEEVITKETLDFVYDCPVFVDENPQTGRPRVTLMGE
ncbi:MAG: ABC transporter ATP-binding protein [Deltaproteobacteria bacterium]|jgi:iron complex transport system ATP-binding protein|nr:ABC transporter ATP-binding protein [Deltaproteobacteria bacterium]